MRCQAFDASAGPVKRISPSSSRVVALDPDLVHHWMALVLGSITLRCQMLLYCAPVPSANAVRVRSNGVVEVVGSHVRRAALA
jgi:hypothetical protein